MTNGMDTCKSCGWQIERDTHGLWLDKWQAPICGWDEGMAYDHEPITRKQLANNVRLLVA